MAERNPVFAGWKLVGWTAVLIGIFCVGILSYGVTERGLHLIIRTTAQTSFALFLTAFSSTALLRLMPNAITRWMRKNRRYVGVSFAVSHAFHGAAIIALGVFTKGISMTEVDLLTFIGGGLAYGFIIVMTATSSDAAVRWMGYERWHLVHRIGMYYIWFIFLFSYGGRAMRSVKWSFSVVGNAPVIHCFSLNPTESITSVLPSQRPTEWP